MKLLHAGHALSALLLAAALPAHAEDKAPPAQERAADSRQRPTIRTYLRVTVVDDPNKAPPLPTSRPPAGAQSDRLLRPGERPAPPRPEARTDPPARLEADRPLRPGPGTGSDQRDTPLREGARREGTEGLQRLREELRERVREQRQGDARREQLRPAERKDEDRQRPTPRERVRERLREADRSQRDTQ